MWLRTVAHKGFHTARPNTRSFSTSFCCSTCALFYLNLLPIKKGFCGCHKVSFAPNNPPSDNLVTSVKQEGRASAGITSQMPNHSLKKRLISFHHRRWAVALKPNICAIQKISLEAGGEHTTVFYHAGMRNTVLLSSIVSGVVHFMKIVSVFASPIASLCKLCFLPQGHYDLMILGKICLTKYYKTSLMWLILAWPFQSEALKYSVRILREQGRAKMQQQYNGNKIFESIENMKN